MHPVSRRSNFFPRKSCGKQLLLRIRIPGCAPELFFDQKLFFDMSAVLLFHRLLGEFR